ncbi:MAG: YjjG family noncanonical pyrimidine nucleotidase [Eubacterium sp.]|nr:YjjG family noncanonical pyrimidine nucleotidase [Eubacterium sp.]
MIKVILWDLDNTLLDFLYAEKMSLRTVFKTQGFWELTDAQVAAYSAINNRHWEKLERGECTKEQVMHNRFAEFLQYLGITGADPDSLCTAYEQGIADHNRFIENGYDVVASLKGRYRQYVVTNGAYDVQTKRLAGTGLDKLFDGVFISDEVGFEKPSVHFFQTVLSQIEPCAKDEILMVGDSLSSDMQGANNIGIPCCWYNPQHKVNTSAVKTDCEIHSLNEIYQVLGGQ